MSRCTFHPFKVRAPYFGPSNRQKKLPKRTSYSPIWQVARRQLPGPSHISLPSFCREHCKPRQTLKTRGPQEASPPPPSSTLPSCLPPQPAWSVANRSLAIEPRRNRSRRRRPFDPIRRRANPTERANFLPRRSKSRHPRGNCITPLPPIPVPKPPPPPCGTSIQKSYSSWHPLPPPLLVSDLPSPPSQGQTPLAPSLLSPISATPTPCLMLLLFLGIATLRRCLPSPLLSMNSSDLSGRAQVLLPTSCPPWCCHKCA